MLKKSWLLYFPSVANIVLLPEHKLKLTTQFSSVVNNYYFSQQQLQIYGSKLNYPFSSKKRCCCFSLLTFKQLASYMMCAENIQYFLCCAENKNVFGSPDKLVINEKELVVAVTTRPTNQKCLENRKKLGRYSVVYVNLVQFADRNLPKSNQNEIKVSAFNRWNLPIDFFGKYSGFKSCQFTFIETCGHFFSKSQARCSKHPVLNVRTFPKQGF